MLTYATAASSLSMLICGDVSAAAHPNPPPNNSGDGRGSPPPTSLESDFAAAAAVGGLSSPSAMTSPGRLCQDVPPAGPSPRGYLRVPRSVMFHRGRTPGQVMGSRWGSVLFPWTLCQRSFVCAPAHTHQSLTSINDMSHAIEPRRKLYVSDVAKIKEPPQCPAHNSGIKPPFFSSYSDSIGRDDGSGIGLAGPPLNGPVLASSTIRRMPSGGMCGAYIYWNKGSAITRVTRIEELRPFCPGKREEMPS